MKKANKTNCISTTERYHEHENLTPTLSVKWNIQNKFENKLNLSSLFSMQINKWLFRSKQIFRLYRYPRKSREGNVVDKKYAFGKWIVSAYFNLQTDIYLSHRLKTQILNVLFLFSADLMKVLHTPVLL